MRLIVCNINIVIGMLVLMEREVTAISQRLFQYVKTKMMSIDDHRN